MNKLTSIDTSTLANTYYDVKIDEGPIYIEGGILDQMYTDPWYVLENIPLTIVEVSQYSIYVKEELNSIDKVILGDSCVKNMSSEIVTNPGGSIIYFPNPIPEKYKYYNVVYVKVQKQSVFTLSKLEEITANLFKSNHPFIYNNKE